MLALFHSLNGHVEKIMSQYACCLTGVRRKLATMHHTLVAITIPTRHVQSNTTILASCDSRAGKRTSDPKQEGPRPARTGRRQPTTEKHIFSPCSVLGSAPFVCCRYLGRRPVKGLEPSRDNQSLSLQKLLAFDNQPGGQRRLTQVSSSVSTRKQLLP